MKATPQVPELSPEDHESHGRDQHVELDLGGLAITPQNSSVEGNPFAQPDTSAQPRVLDFASEQSFQVDPHSLGNMSLSTTRTVTNTDGRQMDDYADDAQQD